MEKRQFAEYYRPRTLEAVVGQTAAVAQIQGMLKKKVIPNSIIISGESSSGKTTIARILGNAIVNPNHVGVVNSDFHEVTFGAERGIDAVRAIVEQANYKPTQGNYKVFAIDEIAKATPQAFSPLLKALEEPPKQTVFILITDEPDKLPKTILNRLYRIHLQPLNKSDLKKILLRVIKKEQIKLSEKVIKYILNNADVARTALQMLQAANDSGGDEKSIIKTLRVGNFNNETQAVRLLCALYTGKPKILFPILLQEKDSINLITQALRYNEWMMSNFFPDSVYVWSNQHTDLIKKQIGDKPPALSKLTHTHNVLFNLRNLLPTITTFEQHHALLARMGSLIYALERG